MLFITGATGAVGSNVIRFLEEKNVSFKALTRRTEKLSKKQFSNMQIITGNLSELYNWETELKGTDILFLELLSDPKPILEAAKKYGIKKIVFLSSASINHADVETNNNAQNHLAVENLVKAMNFDYVFIRPESFMRNAVYWSNLFKYANDVIKWPALKATYANIHEKDIAEVVTDVLVNFSKYTGEILTLTGSNILSQEEMLSEIIRQSNPKLRLQEQSINEFENYMEKFMAREYIDLRINDWNYSMNNDLTLTDTVLKVTGKEPLTFREWVSDNLDLFK